MNIYAFAYGKLSLLQSIAAPGGDEGPVAFRAARFAPGSPARPSLLAALNSTAAPRREARKKARKAYIAKFEPTAVAEAETEKGAVDERAGEPSVSWQLANKREVASKPITVFDVSQDGRLVSFGCSDLSIGMLDAHTLAPLLKILHAHSFPPTALKFNPSATILVSASADNTIRTVIVPSSFGASGECRRASSSVGDVDADASPVNAGHARSCLVGICSRRPSAEVSPLSCIDSDVSLLSCVVREWGSIFTSGGESVVGEYSG